MKCIFAKTKPSHWMRSKFIDLNCLRLKWRKAIFVIPFTFWNRPSLLFLSRSEISTSFAIPFWAWIIFLSWKKIPTRITPHTGGQEKISMRKEKKPWESQKGIRAQETQMLEGMPKSQEKVITKIKWVYYSKTMKNKKEEVENQRRAAKENMNDVNSQTVDSDSQSLKPWNTLWALWIIFFHSQKPEPTLRACRSPF